MSHAEKLTSKMITIEYERWNGAGDLLNIVDNRNGRYDMFFSDQEQKRLMVADSGANGIMEIGLAPRDSDVSYRVTMHTGLGFCGTVPLCGNGSRCTVAYACKYGIVPVENWANFKFLTGDGVHSASFTEDKSTEKFDVTISMADIPGVTAVNDSNNNDWFANSGSAHFVRFIESGTLEAVNVENDGARLAIEKADLGNGLMVIINFVKEHDGGSIHARCYDTGLGAEILACGSASMAIAVTHAVRSNEADAQRKKSVNWANGSVDVGYTKNGTDFTNNSLRSHVFREVKGTYCVE